MSDRRQPGRACAFHDCLLQYHKGIAGLFEMRLLDQHDVGDAIARGSVNVATLATALPAIKPNAAADGNLS